MSANILSPLPLEGGYSPNVHPGMRPDPGQGPPQSRYVGTARQTRRRHLAFAVLSSLMALVMLIVVAFHGYIAWILAYPYVAPIASNPMQAKNLPFTEIVIPSASGKTTVNGWYIPAPPDVKSARTIVFSHGYGANREEPWVPMYDLANLLHGLEYNIIMFDYGYASPVNKAPATGGYEESQQLLAMIHYAKEQGADEIVVWGFSMGAGTALQTALQTDLISAMILDSMFLPDPETLFHNVIQMVNLPKYPSMLLLQSLLPLWTGTSFNQIPSERVKQTSYPIPIYMVHGTADSKAPVEIAESIAGKQNNPLSSVWIVPDGHHEMLFRLHPKEYFQRAASFLSEVHFHSAIASAT